MSLLSCDALARALSCTLDTDLETAAVPVISARSGDRQLWKYLNLEDFRVLVDRYYKALADGRLHRSGEPDVIRRATDVVQIVINALPEPDNHTGWEEIIDFRGDPESRGKFLAFRAWMRKTAKGELTPAEISQELEERSTNTSSTCVYTK